MAYIWGKKLGVRDTNVEVAAGAFGGVSNTGFYKVFGHAKAVATAFGRTVTIVDVLLLRKTEPSLTQSKMYVYVLGFILVNVDERQDSSVCHNIHRSLYEGREFSVFNFRHSIFITVGFLHFVVSGTGRLSTRAYINFCDSQARVTARAGLTPELTLTISASAEAEIIVSVKIINLSLVVKAGTLYNNYLHFLFSFMQYALKGGITFSAIFNYHLLPELSITFCLNGQIIQNKKCATIEDEWADNRLTMDVWHAWRGMCDSVVSYLFFHLFFSTNVNKLFPALHWI